MKKEGGVKEGRKGGEKGEYTKSPYTLEVTPISETVTPI